MVSIYRSRDANPAALGGGRIAILGYGSQGRAQALNLRDSGFEVVIGDRPGRTGENSAVADGFPVVAPGQAVAEAALVALLTPDVTHREVYGRDIAPNLKRGGVLLFAHGSSIHYREIEPRYDIDVVLVAPGGSGERVRRAFEAGPGLPCLFAVRQDATGSARARALAYAWGIGGTAGGAIETSFAEQAETDLFARRAALRGEAGEWAGGAFEMPAFEMMVEAGYQPEVAAFACNAVAGDPQAIAADCRPADERLRDELASLLRTVQRGEIACDPPLGAAGARPQNKLWNDGQAETRAA